MNNRTDILFGGVEFETTPVKTRTERREEIRQRRIAHVDPYRHHTTPITSGVGCSRCGCQPSQPLSNLCTVCQARIDEAKPGVDRHDPNRC